MTTVQLIGIAVASLAVLLLVVALIVSTRKRRADPEAPEARPDRSFLDDAPQDTFADLGKVEQPVEDVTIDPAVERAAAGVAPRSERPPQPGGLGLDWGPDLSVKQTGPSQAPDGEAATQAAPPAPPLRDAPGSGVHLVPLSDIIVTTSNKIVDLHDAEVRRMLTELLTFEIDQATESRRQGQTVDAVLQLTEAEKVARALGMSESAERIHSLMEEIRRQQ